MSIRALVHMLRMGHAVHNFLLLLLIEDQGMSIPGPLDLGPQNIHGLPVLGNLLPTYCMSIPGEAFR